MVVVFQFRDAVTGCRCTPKLDQAGWDLRQSALNKAELERGYLAAHSPTFTLRPFPTTKHLSYSQIEFLLFTHPLIALWFYPDRTTRTLWVTANGDDTVQRGRNFFKCRLHYLTPKRAPLFCRGCR